MTDKSKIYTARGIFLLYIAVVLFLCFSHLSGLPEVQNSIFGIPTDKIVHFAMFFPFVTLSYYAVGSKLRSFWEALLMITAIMIVGCIIAAATEIVQGYLPYRSEDPLDFRADCISLGIGSLITLLIDIKRRRRPRRARK